MTRTLSTTLVAMFAVNGCTGTPSEPTPLTPKSPACAQVVVDEVIACEDITPRTESWFDILEAPILPQETLDLVGGGIAVGDIDNDGDQDMLVFHDENSQVWIQYGKQWDEQSASRFPLVDLTDAVSGSLVDIEGDGDLDLFVVRWNKPNVLLRNDGTGHFQDYTDETGLAGLGGRGQVSSWGDIDRDGDLDLFVGAYGDPPESYTNATDAADPAHLYLNDGNGRFTEVSERLPPEVHDSYTFAAVWLDTNDDGFPELFTFHDFGATPGGEKASRMLLNNQGNSFTFVDNGVARPFEDMGVGISDFNSDGLPDFALTSFRKLGFLRSFDGQATWVESANAVGFQIDPDTQAYGWGASFADIENDGDEDLAVGFGYWSTYTGNQDPRYQPDALFLQDAGSFSDVARLLEMDDETVTRAVVWADLNDDGYPDLIKRSLDGPTRQFLSRCGPASWSRIKLRQANANSRAIGARIQARWGNERVSTRWILAGAQSLYASEPAEAHFGFGLSEDVDLTITWPDGEQCEVRSVPTRAKITISRLGTP